MAGRAAGGAAAVGLTGGAAGRTVLTTASPAETIALGERLGRLAAAGDLV